MNGRSVDDVIETGIVDEAIILEILRNQPEEKIYEYFRSIQGRILKFRHEREESRLMILSAQMIYAWKLDDTWALKFANQAKLKLQQNFGRSDCQLGLKGGKDINRIGVVLKHFQNLPASIDVAEIWEYIQKAKDVRDIDPMYLSLNYRFTLIIIEFYKLINHFTMIEEQASIGLTNYKMNYVKAFNGYHLFKERADARIKLGKWKEAIEDYYECERLGEEKDKESVQRLIRMCKSKLPNKGEKMKKKKSDPDSNEMKSRGAADVSDEKNTAQRRTNSIRGGTDEMDFVVLSHENEGQRKNKIWKKSAAEIRFGLINQSISIKDLKILKFLRESEHYLIPCLDFICILASGDVRGTFLLKAVKNLVHEDTIRPEFKDIEGRVRRATMIPVHKNVVSCHKIWTEDNVDFSSSSRFPGIPESIRSNLRGDTAFFLFDYYPHSMKDLKTGLVGEYEMLVITNQLLLGINHLQENKIVHRGLKPENIFVEGKRVLIGGFDKAIDCSRVKEFDIEVTYDILPLFDFGETIGYPEFKMQLEILRGQRFLFGDVLHLNHKKCDIYGLGEFIYSMYKKKQKQKTLPVEFAKRIKFFVSAMMNRDVTIRLGFKEAIKQCQFLLNEKMVYNLDREEKELPVQKGKIENVKKVFAPPSDRMKKERGGFTTPTDEIEGSTQWWTKGNTGQAKENFSFWNSLPGKDPESEEQKIRVGLQVDCMNFNSTVELLLDEPLMDQLLIFAGMDAGPDWALIHHKMRPGLSQLPYYVDKSVRNEVVSKFIRNQRPIGGEDFFSILNTGTFERTDEI